MRFMGKNPKARSQIPDKGQSSKGEIPSTLDSRTRAFGVCSLAFGFSLASGSWPLKFREIDLRPCARILRGSVYQI
jgi:hypothetical protein